MLEKIQFKRLAISLACAALLQSANAGAVPVAVRHTEGLVHGFLLLSNLEGKPLAYGDLTQVARGGRVTNHLVFRFKDGSVRDESIVYSQRGVFKMLRYHLAQKGPTFPYPMEVTIDGSSSHVTIRYTDDGKDQVATEQKPLPPDLANGLILTLLKNIRPDDAPATVSMLAATPKPRLVKLKISARGEEPFSAGDLARKAMHYVVKVEIGGVAGVMAPLVGKQPPDLNVWVLQGEAPAFVKSEGPLFEGGPIWRIELMSPAWPHPVAEDSGDSKKTTSEK